MHDIRSSERSDGRGHVALGRSKHSGDPAGSHLHDRRGYVGMGTPTAKALEADGDKCRKAPVRGPRSVTRTDIPPAETVAAVKAPNLRRKNRRACGKGCRKVMAPVMGVARWSAARTCAPKWCRSGRAALGWSPAISRWDRVRHANSTAQPPMTDLC